MRGVDRARGDQGLVIVMVALVMVALMVVVALVIDLSFVRQTRQANKSSTDFAVTAGMHGLETPDGIPRPWGGVCEALEYLKANHSNLGDLTGTYQDGNGAAVSPPGDPCASPTTAPYTTLCSPNAKDTWAWFKGTADGGRLAIEIKSGYLLPDPEFPEDATAYGADSVGDSEQGGCDQLAVILRMRDPRFFGGAAGASEYATVIRSVGRVKIDPRATETVALLLLEQKDCETLVTEGNNTYVLVQATPIGAPTNPGLIQANSNATGACSGSSRVLEGSSACPALANCVGAGPSIVAQDATAAVPPLRGRVGIRAVGGVQNGFSSTPACASASTPTAGCTVSPVPVARGIVTRAPVDNRYLTAVTALKSAAAATGPTGYFVVSNTGACNALMNTTVSTATTGGNPKVYLNCNLSVGPSETITFDDTITDVVVTGNLDVKGVFIARNARNIVVKGSTGVSVQGAIRINRRGATSCTDRFNTFPRSEITKFVVLSGSFQANSSGTLVALCNTFLFLADGTLPTTPGTPPSDNSSNGKILVGSSASLDWKAPNKVDTFVPDGDPLLADFEDLALWTEFSGNGSPGTGAGIGGQGTVVTSGVFFLPNANPFNISGGGTGAELNADAQFVVRKLRLSGTVRLKMSPSPNNSVLTPKFVGADLIR
jgi:hypothetical protein